MAAEQPSFLFRHRALYPVSVAGAGAAFVYAAMRLTRAGSPKQRLAFGALAAITGIELAGLVVTGVRNRG